MQPYTIIPYQEKFPVELSYIRLGNAVRHWHENPQLFFVLSGHSEFVIDNTRYCLKAGDVILVNAHQIHEIQSEDSILLVILFDISFFVNQEIDTSKLFFNCNSTECEETAPYQTIKQILAHLVKANAGTDENKYLLNDSLMFHLVYELMSKFLADTSQTAEKVEQNVSRLQFILDYLNKHYRENISLAKAAEQVYLSPSYLSHYFEQNMGISFSRYLTNLRLEKSLIPLIRTSISIEELSALCGFGNSRSYTRFFKNKYGILPSEYRKKYRNSDGMTQILAQEMNSQLLNLEKSSALEHLTAYLESPPSIFQEQYHQFPSKENVIKININKITENDFSPAPRVINLGHIRNAVSHTVQEMLRSISELGFTHVFCHSIFDDSMMFYQTNVYGEVMYYFDMIDEALDYLISCHLKPIIQFSYMPRQLALNPDRVLAMNQSIHSMPKDMNRWKDMVRQFLRHVQDRYGLAEIRSWLFTTFIELPLPYVSQHNKMRDYYELYRETWLTIKEYHSDFKVALPPSTCEPFLPNSFKELLQWCEEKECLPDSYLLAWYGIEKDEAGTEPPAILFSREAMKECSDRKLSKNPMIFQDMLEEWDTYMKDKPKRPTYMIAWSFSPWHNELLKDTCFAACHIIKNALEIKNGFSFVCIPRMTDWAGGADSTGTPFYGGHGIFTRNGVCKPTYWAFLFLNSLQPYLMAKGEGWLFTQGEDKCVGILYNYCHFSDLYADGEMLDVDSVNRYRAFSDAKPVRYSFQFYNVPKGQYRLHEVIVNRRYGSSFDKWVDMGASSQLVELEVEQLKQVSIPLYTKHSIQNEGKTVEYSAVLEPYEIRLVELIEL